MSDESVRAALRSDCRLVVVEAPAGCGKTHQGADYVSEVAQAMPSGRALILTHTHAACTVFAERARAGRTRVDIRTIDSIVASIAGAYYLGLGLPADTTTWIRQHKNGYAEAAARVSALLVRYPMIGASLARRHPIVVCDEHQDSSGHQHSLVMSLLTNGARLRVFADPMQRIFGEKILPKNYPMWDWSTLKAEANVFEELDTPHRWKDGCPELGKWTLAARTALKEGRTIDLRHGVPRSVEVVFAENESSARFDYRISKASRKEVDTFERRADSLLVLTHYNKTARSLRAFFNRRIPLWEGHIRHSLEKMVDATERAEGDAGKVAGAAAAFLAEVCKGFSASAFGDELQREAQNGCIKQRKGKPAKIQELAKLLLREPDHRGISKLLRQVFDWTKGDPAFAGIELDCYREFWDAIRLGEFGSAALGLLEITGRRAHMRPQPPARAISTIHKAKGLECDSVALVPCDSKTFPDNERARCLLYVALSRARKRVLLVVSKRDPSPLLVV